MLNSTDTSVAEPTTAAPSAASPRGGSLLARRRPDLTWLPAALLVVAVAAQLPVLRTHLFYYYDDSASVLIPGWRLIGDRLLGGHLPLLDVNTWMGGDFAGEAQFGIFNPLMMANAVMVAVLPDLAIAATVMKTEFLVLLAAGVYLLAREYGARPAAAAVVAVALPFSGYTLFWDAESWVTGLVAFALTTHFWWTLRRFVRGRLHPAVPLLVGALATTAGSPYAVLGVLVVLVVVAVERLLNGDRRRLVGLAVIGLAAGLIGAVTFLPLLGIQAVGWRSGGGVTNDMELVPGLGQLVNLSAPSYVPRVYTKWHGPSTPMVYLSWFLVPLLPWFAWSALSRVRARAGLLVFGAAYLLLALGPSNLWLFRWPARLIEYVYLAVCVAVAIMLSAGLRTDRLPRRILLSAGLVAAETYLTWANAPETGGRAVVAALLVAVLVALVVAAARYRQRLVAPALIAGTVAVLAVQLLWFPSNLDVTPWRFPHNVAQLRATFADRADGNTMTVAHPDDLPPASRQPAGAWRDFVFGDLNQVAGMASINSYSGMGNQKFADALCLWYHGATCGQGYGLVFGTDAGTGRPLADLLRLRTVAVFNGYLPDGFTPPPGWEIARRTQFSTTLRRVDPLPYPAGRVSWAAPSVTVTADTVAPDLTTGTDEKIRYTGTGRLLVAALAWPGWHATVDGHPVPVTAGPAGLIQVDLPERAAGGTLRLSFTPAGLPQGVASLTAGVLLGAGYCVLFTLRRRRPRPVTPGTAGSPAAAG